MQGLSLLGRLHAINLERAVDFILRCKNFDEAFGMPAPHCSVFLVLKQLYEGAVPHAESHAGQVVPCSALVMPRSRLFADVLLRGCAGNRGATTSH